MSNVVRFNNKPLPEWVRVKGITFPALPDITHKESVVPRRFGNVDSGVEIGGKTFSFEVFIKLEEGNIQDRAQELKAWLKGSGWGSTGQLVFEESPDYYYLARNISVADVNDLFLYGESSIQFRASDGIRYSRYSNKLPFTYSELAFVYAGQEDTPVQIIVEVLEDFADFTIEHIESGKEITINDDFKKGQTVVLDSSKKLVKTTEYLIMDKLNIQSRWLALSTGRNTFRLSVGDGSVEYVDVTLEYTERN